MNKIQKNIDTTSLTTMRMKSKADFYLKAENIGDIKNGIEFSKTKKISFCIIGNGSNILFKNKIYKGLIIQIAFNAISLENKILRVDAGVKLPVLANFCQKNKIAGFEWLAQIPGTLGGAIFMNAGAFGKNISDNLLKVQILNPAKGKTKAYKESDLEFDYRHSSLQEKNQVILRAWFKTKTTHKKKICQKTQEYFAYRKSHHPIDKFTLGSTFKNPVINGIKKSAGELLDQAGCKKMRINDAQVSDMHANFIINNENATSQDVLQLIKLMREKVKEKFNIDLELEIRIIY